MLFRQKRFYVDTSVWRDYLEDRSDGLRPLGLFAFQFFQYCNKNKCVVYYSDLVVKELLKRFTEEEIASGFSIIEPAFLYMLNISPSATTEAGTLMQKKGIHQSDAIHATLAKEAGATLISRDAHFNEVNEFVEVKTPEEII